MKYKLNMQGLEVKVPETTMNPEIHIDFKGMTIEVDDLSLSEYALFMKEMFSMGKEVAKEVIVFQQEMQERNDEFMRSRMQNCNEALKKHAE
ncbi:hypothetical protein M3Y14_34000 (plasmid) [Bacillus thuringiensis]|uniref:hypothetical protein n=1 Tax=Bacillus thuringiensis TaxID=1428 RepID=UPI0022251062|nr:hypothetical protein [Bacillus thuringiensis]UYX56262.1 hypothetical protein M3Y14_34000 [Bacillus thuringiensis]